MIKFCNSYNSVGISNGIKYIHNLPNISISFQKLYINCYQYSDQGNIDPVIYVKNPHSL